MRFTSKVYKVRNVAHAVNAAGRWISAKINVPTAIRLPAELSHRRAMVAKAVAMGGRRAINLCVTTSQAIR